MTNALKSKIAKAGLGLLAAASMLLGASTAGALTMAEAQGLIAALGLTGTQAAAVMAMATGSASTPTSCYQFNTNLSMGMTSNDVKELQKVLNSNSATSLAVASGANGSAGKETTYFGAATKAAVVKYQAWKSISPTSGFVGPLTRNVLNTSCTTPTTPTTPTNPTGPVMAMLATSNPSAGTLVAGQATADLAHYTFTGSGTVMSLSLQRTGVSNNTVFDNVYLYEGNTRVSDAASVNSMGVITFNGLNWAVNGSRTLSVRADVSSSASSQTAGVTLTSYTVSGSTSAMTANLAGNIMNVVSGSGVLGTVNVGTNTATGTSVNAGTSQYTFWSAPVSVGTHSMWMKSLALRYVGSAPNDALANMKLYVDGTAVATSTGVNAMGYVVFDLMSTPFNLTTGSHTFDVRADVVKGSNRTVQLSLQNRADLMVTDSQANINVAPSSPSSGSFTTNSGATVTISLGSVTVSIDPSFQSATNVTGGATNAVIAKYKMKAYGEDVKVQSLQVTPNVANGAASGSTDLNSLNNVALYFNGAQVGSSSNWTTGTITFNLGSSLIIPAGVDSYLEVRADIITSDNVNFTAGTVTATLEGSASMNNGQGLNSLDSTIDVPAADVTTTGLTIATGVLSISANPAYTNQTVNPNMNNVKIGSFVLQNQSSSEGVRITNLKVDLDFTTIASTNLSNLVTSETSGSGATPINPASGDGSTDSVNNFPVDFTLGVGQTKVIDIFASLGTASSGSVVVGLTPTALGVNSNVVVTPTEATGQTINLATGTFSNAGIVVSSSTQPQYVAAAGNGATDATKATFNFKASSGSATISELKFTVVTSSGASVSSVRVGTVTAPVVSGVAYLTGLNLTVPNGGSGLNVDVFMTYGPVGTNGNTSGAESLVQMTYIKYTIGGTTSTLVGGDATLGTNTTIANKTASGAAPAAVGSTASLVFDSTALMQPGMMIVINNTTDTVGMVQSITNSTTAVVQTLFLGTNDNAGTTVHFFSVPQTAVYSSSVNNCPALSVAGTTVAAGSTSLTDCMSIVGSKPVLTMVDSTDPLVNGLVKIGSVTVAADSHGDIAVNTVPLTITSTGNVTIASGSDNLVIKNAADQTTITTTNNTLAVTAGGSDDTTVTFTGGYTVTGGSSVTFDIYATAATVTNGPGANQLSTKLGAAASLTWTDTAGSGSTGAETGTLIYNYPTNSAVIND